MASSSIAILCTLCVSKAATSKVVDSTSSCDRLYAPLYDTIRAQSYGCMWFHMPALAQICEVSARVTQERGHLQYVAVVTAADSAVS